MPRQRLTRDSLLEEPDGFAVGELMGVSLNNETVGRFVTSLKQLPEDVGTLVVMWNCTGGKLPSALQLADELEQLRQQQGMRVIHMVCGVASSAASHVVLAKKGNDAVFMMPEAVIGIHRPVVSRSDKERTSTFLPTIDEENALMQSYGNETQIRSYLQTGSALSRQTWELWTRSEEMTYLSPEKAAFFGLITDAKAPQWLVDFVLLNYGYEDQEQGNGPQF